MSNSTKIILALVIGLVIGAIVGVSVLAPEAPLGGDGVVTETNSVNFIDGAHIDKFSQGGGVYSLSSDSADNATTTQAILEGNSVIYLAAGGAGQGTLTLLLPATSTLTTLLPDAGDFREWIIDASDLAAATTTTITAGTGIDLVAVTTNDDVIDGAEISRLSCYREVSRDVTCIVSELLDAD